MPAALQYVRMLVAVAATALGTEFTRAQDPHHIGALLPNSGPMTPFGELFRNGADLAAEHINADKMFSKPFTINHEDSQGAPQPAVTGHEQAGARQLRSRWCSPRNVRRLQGDRADRRAREGRGDQRRRRRAGPREARSLFLQRHSAGELRGARAAALSRQGKEDQAHRDRLRGGPARRMPACASSRKTRRRTAWSWSGAFSVPSTSRQFAPIAAKVREVKPDAVYVAYFGQTMVALVKQLRDAGVDKTVRRAIRRSMIPT